MNEAKFKIGDLVAKSSGYDFPGYVVAVFRTMENRLRYVVEHSISYGLLHIFSEEQLRSRSPYEDNDE